MSSSLSLSSSIRFISRAPPLPPAGDIFAYRRSHPFVRDDEVLSGAFRNRTGTGFDTRGVHPFRSSRLSARIYPPSLSSSGSSPSPLGHLDRPSSFAVPRLASLSPVRGNSRTGEEFIAGDAIRRGEMRTRARTPRRSPVPVVERLAATSHTHTRIHVCVNRLSDSDAARSDPESPTFRGHGRRALLRVPVCVRVCVCWCDYCAVRACVRACHTLSQIAPRRLQPRDLSSPRDTSSRTRLFRTLSRAHDREFRPVTREFREPYLDRRRHCEPSDVN